MVTRKPLNSLHTLTFVDVLRQQAARQPDAIAYTFLHGSKVEERSVTFAEVDREARAIAALLGSLNMRGQRAIILLPSGLEYISVFFGCMYAGVIAIPGFPPHFARQGRRETWWQAVVNNARPALAFASPETARKITKWSEGDPLFSGIRWIHPDTIELAAAEEWKPLDLTADTVTFLQYTSGSTSNPKGVMVSHGNILHNQRVIQTACDNDRASTVVGWLPLYHDMGLVGTVLHPVYLGARSILMAPGRFFQNPVCWLQAISEYKGKSSSAPNFAYDLCCRKITEEQKKDLDLTSWRIAVNGAEPVRQETMQRFAAAFSKCGFQASAFLPSYGLAESTLMVTGSRTLEMPLTEELSVPGLEENVARQPEKDETARLAVGCGSTLLEQEIRIVDPLTLELEPERSIGEIWVRGPSVAQGYWNRPDETAQAFQAKIPSTGEGPFLRTGDLGFISGKQLFVTGRLKDLIIIRGRNLYPQDIETTAQNCHASLQPGCSAAFTVEVDEQESLVLIGEIERHAEARSQDVITTIREAVALEHGVQTHTVVLVKSGAIPKTTSGKIRRSACREFFLADKFEKIAIKVFPPAAETSPDGMPAGRHEVLQISPELRQEFVQSRLQAYLAAMLNISIEEAVPSKPLVTLGLDSLSAVRFGNAIEAGLGVQLDLLDFLRGSSLNTVAAAVVELLAVQDKSVTGQHSIRDSRSYHPLTLGQRGLWILHQAAPESVAYVLANAARVKGKLDVDALQRSFQLLMARHDMLRTIFPIQEEEPIQQILPPAAISFDRHVQYRELPASISLRECLEEEVHRPFLLETEPPIRLLIFRISEEEHVLLLALHHIIADLWSLDVLLEELGILYSGERDLKPVQLPQIKTTYLQFAYQQEENIHSSKTESLLGYWLGHLSGELPVLQLPADRPRPHARSYRGTGETVHFKPGLYAQIDEIAREAGATPFMALVAAFQLLLHRISGQDDLLIGTPTSGRTQSEFSRVIGYCVNPVVLRSQYDGGKTFSSWLAEVRRTVLAAFEFQDCPFPLLVEKLQPERDSSISPIFQSFFVWQKPQSARGEALGRISVGEQHVPLVLDALRLESIPLANAGSQFDLTLMMTACGVNLAGLIKYSTDLFDPATIQRLGAEFSVLLEGIVANPQQPISALPLCTKEEREQLIRDWVSPAAIQYSSDGCLHRRFEEQARCHPERTALIVGEKRLSYSELNQRVNQFARYLRVLGVGTEVRVGICLDRSIELIVAILGIWKAGGAYVPFDSRDPKERLCGLIERSSIHVLITHEQLLDRLPEQLPHLVLLDLDLDVIALEAVENPDIVTPPQSLAYVIYTSGSTGQPKGTMIQHGSVMNLLSALGEAIYDVHAESPLRIGLNAPISFDSSVKQLATLAMGHTLCVVLEDIRRNGEALMGYVQKASLDALDCTPTQLELLLQAGFMENRDKVMLLLGGEPIPLHAWKLLSDLPGPPCYNVYGPTECTVDATICQIASRSTPSLGRALTGVQIYLLDSYLEPTPIGVAGEIFIGGDSVGRGYVDQPGLTAEKFLPDPFNTVPGARMYRTGDRARYATSGDILFIGRMDRQVKIRGFRIELGEIEEALVQIPGVQDAAVVVNENKLIAYVVSSLERPANAYRQLIAQRVPEYMVPAAVAVVPTIPTNANGKKDCSALPRLQLSVMERGNDYISPGSVIEQYLVELWTELLRVQPIGIHDNFFALGGDSLQATRMISRVQENYQSDTPLLALFFQEPTVAALSQVLTLSYQTA